MKASVSQMDRGMYGARRGRYLEVSAGSVASSERDAVAEETARAAAESSASIATQASFFFKFAAAVCEDSLRPSGCTRLRSRPSSPRNAQVLKRPTF